MSVQQTEVEDLFNTGRQRRNSGRFSAGAIGLDKLEQVPRVSLGEQLMRAHAINNNKAITRNRMMDRWVASCAGRVCIYVCMWVVVHRLGIDCHCALLKACKSCVHWRSKPGISVGFDTYLQYIFLKLKANDLRIHPISTSKALFFRLSVRSWT